MNHFSSGVSFFLLALASNLWGAASNSGNIDVYFGKARTSVAFNQSKLESWSDTVRELVSASSFRNHIAFPNIDRATFERLYRLRKKSQDLLDQSIKDYSEERLQRMVNAANYLKLRQEFISVLSHRLSQTNSCLNQEVAPVDTASSTSLEPQKKLAIFSEEQLKSLVSNSQFFSDFKRYNQGHSVCYEEIEDIGFSKDLPSQKKLFAAVLDKIGRPDELKSHIEALSLDEVKYIFTKADFFNMRGLLGYCRKYLADKPKGCDTLSSSHIQIILRSSNKKNIRDAIKSCVIKSDFFNTHLTQQKSMRNESPYILLQKKGEESLYLYDIARRYRLHIPVPNEVRYIFGNKNKVGIMLPKKTVFYAIKNKKAQIIGSIAFDSAHFVPGGSWSAVFLPEGDAVMVWSSFKLYHFEINRNKKTLVCSFKKYGKKRIKNVFIFEGMSIVQGSKALYIYNPLSHKLEELVPSVDHGDIESFHLVNHEYGLLEAANGIYMCNLQEKSVHKVEGDVKADNRVHHAFYMKNKNKIIFSKYNTIYSYDIDSKACSRVGPELEADSSGFQLCWLYQINDHEVLWACTEHVYIIDVNTDLYEKFSPTFATKLECIESVTKPSLSGQVTIVATKNVFFLDLNSHKRGLRSLHPEKRREALLFSGGACFDHCLVRHVPHGDVVIIVGPNAVYLWSPLQDKMEKLFTYTNEDGERKIKEVICDTDHSLYTFIFYDRSILCIPFIAFSLQGLSFDQLAWFNKLALMHVWKDGGRYPIMSVDKDMYDGLPKWARSDLLFKEVSG